MIQKVNGTVHGKMIELDSPLNMADGQAVVVTVSPLSVSETWGEGIKKSAGGWAAYPEMDEIMDRIHAERKLERRSSSCQ
jgi:hypothetical protein